MSDVRRGEPVFRVANCAEVTDAELARAAEILHAAFRSWPGRYRPVVSDVEHLRWKLDAPGDRPCCMTLAEVDALIIGFAVHQSPRVQMRGKPSVVRYSTESAIHPDWQGRGIHSKRLAYMQVELDPFYDINLSISHNPKVLHYRDQRGDQSIAWRMLVRPYDLRRMSAADARRAPTRARTRLRAALYPSAVRALSWAGRLRYPGREPAKPSWAIRAARAFDERADEFARRAAEPFDLIQRRDRRFLHWRYLDPRSARYSVLVAEERDELLGYVAYRTEGEQGYLVDVLALPGRLDVVRTLIGAADRDLQRSGAMSARCWFAPGHPYFAVLREHGFILSRYETGLTYRCLRMDPSELEFMKRPDARIHLTAGDFDSV